MFIKGSDINIFYEIFSVQLMGFFNFFVSDINFNWFWLYNWKDVDRWKCCLGQKQEVEKFRCLCSGKWWCCWVCVLFIYVVLNILIIIFIDDLWQWGVGWSWSRFCGYRCVSWYYYYWIWKLFVDFVINELVIVVWVWLCMVFFFVFSFLFWFWCCSCCCGCGCCWFWCLWLRMYYWVIVGLWVKYG